MRSSSDGITDLTGQKDLKDVRIGKNVFHIIIFGFGNLSDLTGLNR